jgi:alkylated DNA repair dioxygenase AlkB
MFYLGDSDMLHITIPGLQYHPAYLDSHQQDALRQKIDAQKWSTELKRRVQHYGYKYDYRKRKIEDSMVLGSLPDWLVEIAEKLQIENLMPAAADQVIINEYLPGQGISAHVDCEPCFGDTIASISLGSCCVMDFRNKHDKRHVPILLEPGSLLVFSGEARYQWTHGIVARTQDIYVGQNFLRERRLSITFRTIIQE